MPIKLSEINSQTKTVDVFFDEEKTQTMKITYKLNFYTSEFEDMLFDFNKDNKENERILQSQVLSLANILTDWDLLDDKGKKLPTTVENIKKIPGVWVFKIAQAINEASNPNETTSSS